MDDIQVNFERHIKKNLGAFTKHKDGFLNHTHRHTYDESDKMSAFFYVFMYTFCVGNGYILLV